MDPDPWAVLGIPATATLAQARRAYASKARLLHPDRHPGASDEVLAESQRAMSELNVAWRTVETSAGRDGATPSAASPRPPVATESAPLLLERSLASAHSALDLVRATRQLRDTTAQSLLRRWDRARLTQLNAQLDEMLRHAETRRAHARKVLTDLGSKRVRPDARRRLVRHHRLGVRVHELAVQCHRHLLLAVPVDPLVSEMETILTDMEKTPG